MEPITGSNLQIIKNCINFVRANDFLLLPDSLNYYFEDCPSARFPTMDNACESNSKELIFNKPWFLKRTTEHKADLEFFIFHELRHVHQLHSIDLFLNGCQCKDKPETIVTWKQGFERYVKNTGGSSQNLNVSQEVEIDANAFGLCLVNLLHLEDSEDLSLSLPEEAARLAEPRSELYYDNNPKFKDYINAYNIREALKHQQLFLPAMPTPNNTVQRGRKIEPNEKCPCGSNKKFKKCCRGKGIYD